jgi:2-succinyl-5-enolpyruvyl-6-hydroxy-3-cyclohexene-1-carboxylate synthase
VAGGRQQSENEKSALICEVSANIRRMPIRVTSFKEQHDMSERKTGGQIIWESMLHEGVDVVFGLPGGAILPAYDDLYKYNYPIHHVLVTHEQGASHMADGYARATGRVGVCIATSGPGATNLITGLATAYMDSTPVVAVTGQVPTSLLGRDGFQEADILGSVCRSPSITISSPRSTNCRWR